MIESEKKSTNHDSQKNLHNLLLPLTVSSYDQKHEIIIYQKLMKLLNDKKIDKNYIKLFAAM